jgi:hypothetical protein
MIEIKSTGSFRKTRKLLKKVTENDINAALAAYGEKGAALLAAATPVRSGTTASSWSYEIEKSNGSVKLVWTNSNIVGGVFNLAVLIQYGHGTGTGGYVQGIDYINPALRPLFEEIANSIWKEVISV